MPRLTANDNKLTEANQSISILKNRMIVRENKSEQTFKRYLDGIKEFTRFLNAKNPDEALAVFSNMADRTGKLDEFIDYMLGKKRSSIDVKSKWHGVKKWLVSNRVNNIDYDFISRPKTVSQIQDRIPTVDELRLILDNKVTLRDKAFFIVVAAAGFRIGTALSLQVKDYKPIEELGMITVEGGEGRKLVKGKRYFTFITPEARRLLEQYLKTREPLSIDAPLFAKESKGSGEQFGYVGNVSRQWTILVKRAKLLEKIPHQKGYTLHGHSLRKFFQTHTKLAGCRADFVDFWMGHHPTGAGQYLNDSYFRPDLKEHLAEYRKAVSSLTVFEVSRGIMDKAKSDIEHLKRENEELKSKIDLVQNSKGTLEARMAAIETALASGKMLVSTTTAKDINSWKTEVDEYFKEKEQASNKKKEKET